MAMGSIADTVVVPLQDLLGLGSDARMNVPGRADGNWSWRFDAAAIDNGLPDRLKSATTTFGRSPRFTTRAAIR